jgi:mono-ADP-ribosyltransferase sirtuin 6
VLGSSLTVTPANEIPAAVGKRRRQGAKLVICNLQATPLDGEAGLRVHAKTDELMVRVMRELGVEIPRFVLRRRLAVTVERAVGAGQRVKVAVAGVDVDGTPVSFLRAVKLVNNRRLVKAEPFVFELRASDSEEDGLELRLELGFMGHYGERDLELVHLFQDDATGTTVVYLLEYDPSNGEWKTTKQ